MLIPFSTVYAMLKARGIPIRGILHIGAHECEERADYNKQHIPDTAIDWVEANPALVHRMATRGITVHNAAISDISGELPFYITNNGQSSSLLPFGTHATSYPWCKVVETITVKTQRLDSLIAEKAIPMKDRNFWNLDIQGAELSALRSAGDVLKSADAIYLEVNTQEVYKGCAILSELDTFLGTAGFQRIAIKMTDAGWGDALFVRVSS
jgi:FkbM family methyltransferase